MIHIHIYILYIYIYKYIYYIYNIYIYIYIYYIINQWPRDLCTDFTSDNCLFGSVKLTKNAADPG